MSQPKVVVGLGNPGSQYVRTRHNVGFEVVRAFAKEHGLSFKKGFRLKGELAEGVINGVECVCLLPMTYMNLSGLAVGRVLGRTKTLFSDPDAFLVVVDDVYLDTGVLRLRRAGSSGGHNGLKSIEEAVGSREYARLKMGVGPKTSAREPLEEFVLSPFDPSDLEKAKKMITKGASIVTTWFDQGAEAASQSTG